MGYIYTETNRFEKPHNYMYSNVNQKRYISDYSKDRVIRSKKYFDEKCEKIFRKSYGKLFHENINYFLEKNTQKFDYFSMQEKINTSELLKYLAPIIFEDRLAEVDFFVSKLLQRFEVSKKLFTFYSSDIRNGEGDSNDIEIYARFALCLSLAYQKTGHLQYLSSQLKLLDIILSLKPEIVKHKCPSLLIAILVDIELYSINKLALQHGVKIID